MTSPSPSASHAARDPGLAVLGLRRTNVPHRRRTPEPAHRRPEGLWTEAGSFTSYRNGMTVHFWNDVQLDFLTLMEVDPRVEGMRARPEAIQWHDGRAWHEHVASFEVMLRDGPLLVEVDSAAGKTKAEIEGGFQHIRRAARLSGRRMVVFGRPHLRIQPRLENAQVVCQCAGDRVPDKDRDLVLRTLGFDGPDNIGELSERSGMGFRRCLTAAMNLVWRGTLAMANDRPAGPDTLVWRVS